MRAGLILLLAAALALSACGRRGAPQRPESNEPRVERFPHDPGSNTVPDRKFILDPILQ